MKILFINRFFYPDTSATSQLLSDLAFYLSAEGLTVEVVASRQRYEDPGAALPVIEKVKGVLARRVWSTRFGRARLLGRGLDYLSFYFSVFFCLLIHLKKGDKVVAETDPPLISVVAMAAAKIRGAKLIIWTQDVFPEIAEALGVKMVSGVLASFFRFVRDLSLKSAAMNVAIGEAMAGVIRARGVDASRVKVIHNWADGDRIKPLAREQNPMRREWGLDGKFVLGYSGNMGRVHEFETILDAAGRLSAETDILFLFIGDGKQKELIGARLKEMNLNNVIFKPLQPYENLGQSLTAADAHFVCLKPELEGLAVPSKFYGILAAGRPVLNIGSAEGEIARWTRQIECGYSVVPGDGAGLAAAILELARRPDKARPMAQKAREFFSQNFDRPPALKTWYDVLTTL